MRKMYFLFTWRVKYMNFMNLTGTSISHFSPFWLPPTSFSQTLDIYPSLGGDGYRPINLYRCSDRDFGALTLSLTLLNLLWCKIRSIKTFSKYIYYRVHCTSGYIFLCTFCSISWLVLQSVLDHHLFLYTKCSYIYVHWLMRCRLLKYFTAHLHWLMLSTF